VTDVVRTKTFRNGGSLAVRIPAGWVDDGELTLSRNPVSGEIVISQRAARLKELLQELSERDPIADPVFDEALARPLESDDKSIFERQADSDAAD
jgi:antitoxin component of MazEF toxin-antitoxin module